MLIEGALDFLHRVFNSGLVLFLMLLFLTIVEMRFGREDMPMKRRLTGVPFQLVQMAGFMLVGTAFVDFYRSIGITPVVDLFAWMGPFVVIGTILWKDFVAYWSHRIVHSYYLWPFHAPHHAPTFLSAINNHNHWTAPIQNGIIVALPLAFIEGSAGLLWWIIAIRQLHAAFTHSNVTFDMGPLRWIVIGPGFHRVHHSMEEEHFDKNFGAMFTIWDVMFGTVYWHDDEYRPPVGVKDFPEPTFRQWWFAPFTYWWHRLPGGKLNPAVVKAKAKAEAKPVDAPLGVPTSTVNA